MTTPELESLRGMLTGLLEAKFVQDGATSDTLSQISKLSGIPLLQITILYLGDMNKLSMSTIVEIGRYTNTRLRYTVVAEAESQGQN
jgi:hypothetical protein